MTTELARATTDFAYYFRSLVAALGERPGWYGVFAEREPGAVQAYSSGAEVPPWDVVRALLHDLAVGHGGAPDPAEAARAQALHRAAVAAWDAAPGAERALRARFDAAARTHDLALMREREAARALDQAAATAPGATTARLANTLAWSRDDRERAAARLAEIGARLAALTGRTDVAEAGQDRGQDRGQDQRDRSQERGQDFWARRTAAPAGPDAGASAAWPPPENRIRPEVRADPVRRPARAPFWGAGADADPPAAAPYEGPASWKEAADPHPYPQAPGAPRPDNAPALPPNVPASRRARFAPRAPQAPQNPQPAEPSVSAPRGARFAGAPALPLAEPEVIPLPGGAAKPRGARFAGAPATAAEAAVVPAPATPAGKAPRGARFAGAPEMREAPPVRVVDPRWAAEAQAGAARLGELRRSGQSGAAYLVLCEAAEGPPERLPYLVKELERTGLAADVATLLWEIAALPPAPLAAAAASLAADGRTDDSRTLLRQVAARPAADIALVAAALEDNARTTEAGELLETLIRAHTPEDAVDVARTVPALTPALLTAAERVSKSRRRDIVAALRRAALPDH
ncbi:hypothetical protein ACFO3J_05915 [Streptomyces polygonati]|uniref:UL36 very large tegument protein n=1 Tax=Streptomyces polygonati TaxID=1617087 RepID=A0ABV8HL67_9ACTN